jgi:hypothetical protein
MLIDDLLIVARTYSGITNRSLSRTSTIVLRDRRRLPMMESGKCSITVRNYELAMRWFSEHWPDGYKWPSGVDRPQRADA